MLFIFTIGCQVKYPKPSPLRIRVQSLGRMTLLHMCSQWRLARLLEQLTYASSCWWVSDSRWKAEIGFSPNPVRDAGFIGSQFSGQKTTSYPHNRTDSLLPPQSYAHETHHNVSKVQTSNVMITNKKGPQYILQTLTITLLFYQSLIFPPSYMKYVTIVLCSTNWCVKS